jgi:hypothetical protein
MAGLGDEPEDQGELKELRVPDRVFPATYPSATPFILSNSTFSVIPPKRSNPWTRDLVRDLVSLSVVTRPRRLLMRPI